MNPKLLSTTNYTLFHPHPSNRPLSEKAVQDLVDSMSIIGFMASKPMTVEPRIEGGFTVLDGQHRLAAAMRLRFPVYYVVETVQINPAVLNGNQRSWKPKDYVRLHAANGKPAYIRLQEVCDKYGVSLTAATLIVTDLSQSAKGVTQHLHNGNMVLTESPASMAVLRILNAVSGPLLRTVFAVLNLKRIAGCEGFDAERMIRQLTTYAHLLHQCANMEQWADLLGTVYDYKRQDRKGYRTILVEEARRAAEGRGTRRV